MKNVIRIGIALVLSMLFVQCKQGLKQNIIKCEIEGLQKGDKIILALGTLTDTPEKVDSIIYDGKTPIELKTAEKDVMASVTVLRKSKEYKRQDSEYCWIFLEGYANLVLKGTAKYLYHASSSGGLYELPEMKKIEKIQSKVREYQKNAFKLLDEVRSEENKKNRNSLNEKAVDFFEKGNKLVSDSLRPLEKEFVKNNPDIAYSAELLHYDYGLKNSKDFSKYENAFMQLSERVRSTRIGKTVARYIVAKKTTEIGHLAPDFTIKDIEGKEISLSDYRGKFVLLEFWTTRCGGCRYAIPHLKKLRKKTPKDNIVMLGIACDEPSEEDWKNLIEKESLKWKQALAKEREIEAMYAVQGYPTFFLLNPEGKIIEKSVGLQQKIIDKVKEIGK